MARKVETPVTVVVDVLHAHGYLRPRTGSAVEWAELARALSARKKWRLAAAVRLLGESIALTDAALRLPPGDARLPDLERAKVLLGESVAMTGRPLLGPRLGTTQ